MRDNEIGFGTNLMAGSKHKDESRLQELIRAAQEMNIEVRTEKLLREVGYRVRSGRCRVNGQELILIDRDAAISDQIEFLSVELAQGQSGDAPLGI
jgi:hypothetical protein